MGDKPTICRALTERIVLFTDLIFIFVFIPAFVLIYLLAGLIDKLFNRHKGAGCNRFVCRNVALVVFSLLFYAWGEPVYILLMLISVIVNYWMGIFIAYSRNAKVPLWIGIIFNLMVLGSFKYLGFFGDTLRMAGVETGIYGMALPIGLSFYIFQSITYLVDVYRREAPVQTNFFNLLLYISLFPQLIAGPIVRYGTIAEELTNRRITIEDLSTGVYRFIIGLGKKVILADTFGMIALSLLVDDFQELNLWGAWIGIAAFALQIYFDFSGYSDMAIGMGRALGFHFRENFNHPYMCKSVTDFWRRWHISLGSFFRDYVYIPMGGNRRRQPLNLLTVWFLTGLWHGPSWNFVAWGLYYGLIVAIEKVTLFRGKRNRENFFTRIYALVAVTLGWAFFFFTDFGDIGRFFSAATGFSGRELTIVHISAIFDYFWIWVIGVICIMPVGRWFNAAVERLASCKTTGACAAVFVRSAVSISILLVCITFLIQSTSKPFLYTRF